MKRKLGIYPALVFAVLSISTAAVFVKLAGAPSAVTAFYRLFLTTLMLLPFLAFHKGNRKALAAVTKKQLCLVVLGGVLLAIHYVMWFESLNYTSVASSTVLVTLQPLFSIVWGVLFLKERYGGRALLGCLIAIAGSVVIGWGDFQVSATALFGDVLAFLAAGLISLYFLIGQVVRKEMPVVPYSVLAFFGSSIFLAVYAFVQGNLFTGYERGTWLAFWGLALITTICGQFVFNLLLKWVPATMVSMSVLGEAVGTCILAWIILKEEISLRQGVGIVIILVGLALYFREQSRQKAGKEIKEKEW